jgi:thymidylate synthase
MNSKHLTIDEQYNNLLLDIISSGQVKKDRTGVGTLSVFGRQIRHKMSDGFPLLTTKKMAWKSIIIELLWFLRGDTNIKFLLNYNCNIWNGDAYKAYKLRHNFQINQGIDILTQDEFINKIKTDNGFAEEWGDLGRIYGAQWRRWKKVDEVWDENLIPPFKIENIELIDQIQNLIKDIKDNPDSRRLMVNAWNVSDLDRMVLPPCHYGFQVYTRELSIEERLRLASKKYRTFEPSDFVRVDHLEIDELYPVPKRAISLMWNQRSVDTFLGLPFNIASYALLLELIAKSVNMMPDELIGNLGDTHLYMNHIKQAEEQAHRTPYELPTLTINTEFWQTLSGECGVGDIDAEAVFNSFKDISFCECLLDEDIQLLNYISHPTIKAPINN